MNHHGLVLSVRLRFDQNHQIFGGLSTILSSEGGVGGLGRCGIPSQETYSSMGGRAPTLGKNPMPNQPCRGT